MVGGHARRSMVAAISLLSVACGDYACGSAEVVHEGNGLSLTVRAVHRRELGVDGIGAAHVGGILWPTLTDEGIAITLTVDDRPEVAIGALDSGDLPDVASAVEVAVSDDALHVAYRIDEDAPFVVLHLLPKGTPFDGEVQPLEGDEVDFSVFDTPEAIALSLLAQPPDALGARPLLWSALHAQDPSDALDVAVLPHWPEHAEAVALVNGRTSGEGATAAFRAALGARALEVVGPTPSAEDLAGEPAYHIPSSAAQAPLRQAFAALAALGGDALSELDERMVRELELRAEAGKRLSHPLVIWVDDRDPSEDTLAGAAPLDPARGERAAVAARALLEHRWIRDGTFQPPEEPGFGFERDHVARLLVRFGSDADRAWLHDRALASFPQTDDSMVLDIARERYGEASDDWKRRAAIVASHTLESDQRERGAHLLVELDAPVAEIDAAFDALFEADEGRRLIEQNLARASSEWKQRTVDRCASERPFEGEDEDGVSHAGLRTTCFEVALAIPDCPHARSFARGRVQLDQVGPRCPDLRE